VLTVFHKFPAAIHADLNTPSDLTLAPVAMRHPPMNAFEFFLCRDPVFFFAVIHDITASPPSRSFLAEKMEPHLRGPFVPTLPE
jgi:hypothetical protein